MPAPFADSGIIASRQDNTAAAIRFAVTAHRPQIPPNPLLRAPRATFPQAPVRRLLGAA
jgi:hypothetical protein